MFEGLSVIQVTAAAVVGLIGLSTCLAWLPATRRDPTGLPTRVFVTIGLVAAILDYGGIGAVLGLSLAAMGLLVMWEGLPAPEVPRPNRRGFYVAAVLAGAVTHATVEGRGPVERIPEDGRPVAALFVGLVAVLGTLAIADRSRISLRDRMRRRFDTPILPPRMLVAPIDRPAEHTITFERLSEDDPDVADDTPPAGAEPVEPTVLSTGTGPAALLPAPVVEPVQNSSAAPTQTEAAESEPTESEPPESGPTQPKPDELEFAESAESGSADNGQPVDTGPPDRTSGDGRVRVRRPAGESADAQAPD